MPRTETGDLGGFAAAFARLLAAAELTPDGVLAALGDRRGLISRTTLYDWKNGVHLPQDLGSFRDVVGVCLRAGHSHRADLGSIPASVEGWLALLSEVRLGRDSHAERQWESIPDKPRPVREWSAARLGVHPSIPRHPEVETGQGFALPTYVRRPHDSKLSRRLEVIAQEGGSGVIEVRGSSCSGKTRSAFEAIHAVLPGWNLIFPANVDGLLAALNADAVLPYTVVWLDDAHHVLDTKAGETAAVDLGRRLDGPSPVVVMITLWPYYHGKLTATPTPGSPDPHQHARALLEHAWLVSIPAAFTETDLQALDDLALNDTALATARRTGRTSITQTLAAVPDLVDHYRHPAGEDGLYGQALISAAMDARRLGVANSLPTPFLRSAAPGYLTDCQRAAADPDTWFDQALNYAFTKVKNVTAALRPVARPTGMGATPEVVQLEDYLEHHARATRGRICPPATFWDAAAHLDDPSDLAVLASAARERWRHRHAHHLYELAGQAGAPSARHEQTEIRKELGHSNIRTVYVGETAGKWVKRALGPAPPPFDLMAWARKEAGDLDGAKQLLLRAIAVEVRIEDAQRMLALIEEEERASRGSVEQRPQASSAEIPIRKLSPELPESDGEDARAEQVYHEQHDLLIHLSLESIVETLEDAGDHAAADHMAQQAADQGYPQVRQFLVRRRQTSAQDMDPDDLKRIAEVREWVGDHTGAERFACLAIEAGDPSALGSVVRLRLEKGNVDETETMRLSRLAAAADDGYALEVLSLERVLSDDWEGAQQRAWDAAQAGNPFAFERLTEARILAGDWEAAVYFARQSADAGNPYALSNVALRQYKAGDAKSAERLARQAADAGDPSPLRNLAEENAIPQSQLILQYGLEANGQPSKPWYKTRRPGASPAH